MPSGDEAYEFAFSGVLSDGLSLAFVIPSEVHEALKQLTDAKCVEVVKEAIRLIADETAGGVILCSTGLKDKVLDVGISQSVPVVYLLLAYPTDAVRYDGGGNGRTKWIEYTITKYGITKHYTLHATDHLTIELDWGDTPFDGGDSDIEECSEADVQHIFDGMMYDDDMLWCPSAEVDADGYLHLPNAEVTADGFLVFDD